MRSSLYNLICLKLPISLIIVKMDGPIQLGIATSPLIFRVPRGWRGELEPNPTGLHEGVP